MKSRGAFAIESPSTGLGIPDVGAQGVFIECKQMDKWPRGCDTNPVRLKHPVLPEQIVWHTRHTRLGLFSLISVQIAQEWFFFDGTDVKLVGHLTRPEMRERAELWFPKNFKIHGQILLDYLELRSPMPRSSSSIVAETALLRQTLRQR